jgi:hypothetical protein
LSYSCIFSENSVGKIIGVGADRGSSYDLVLEICIYSIFAISREFDDGGCSRTPFIRPETPARNLESQHVMRTSKSDCHKPMFNFPRAEVLVIFLSFPTARLNGPGSDIAGDDWDFNRDQDQGVRDVEEARGTRASGNCE